MIDFHLPWQDQFSYLHFDILDSTNNEAKRIANNERQGNFLIVADEQTAGRGRVSRTWHSPKGNLYFSLLLKQKLPLLQAAQLVFLSAIAMGETLELALNKNGPINLSYKWPNDILVNQAKLGGILLETNVCSDSPICEWLVIGIGINLAHHPELEELAYKATSAYALGYKTRPDEILDNFMRNFISCYRLWAVKGFMPIRELWLNKAYKLGQTITVKQNTKESTGVFEGLDEHGNLLLSLNGKNNTIPSGEIIMK